jgi:allantoate deiminase
MTASADLSRLSRAALDLCAELATQTEVPGQTTRTYLCPSAAQVHATLRAWADRLGMTTRLDAVGNLRSRLEGPPGAPTLYLGSHLDTVPNAGAYDGILGVVLGYAAAEALQAGGPLPFNLEVLAFSEEEGVRYGVSFIGSRALVGTADELLGRLDKEGQSVRDAIRAFGLDETELPGALAEANALGYLEVHIEQGPVLQDAGAQVGVVSSIVGQSRLTLDFAGQAAHAGTTPMTLRRDPLAAAARFMVAAEDLARATPGLVATVGMIEARPGAGNVIPGEVSLSLDIRHEFDAVRAQSLAALLDTAEREAGARGVTLAITPRMAEPATPMDAELRAGLREAAADLGLIAPELVSGAGHDAQILAARMPAAMLFVRSPNALSHHPDERVNGEDVEAALAVLVHMIQGLAGKARA